jgi:hypothetical protein
MMRLSYSLDRDEFKAALEAVVGSLCATDMHRGWVRRLHLNPYVFYPVLGLASLLIVIFEPDQWRGLAMFWIAFLLSQVVVSWYVERTQAAQLGATFDPRRHSDVTAVFESDSVSHLGAEHRQTWEWTLLKRFHELPEVYVLEFAGFEMLVVPRRVFCSGEQADSWARGIRGRLAG